MLLGLELRRTPDRPDPYVVQAGLAALERVSGLEGTAALHATRGELLARAGRRLEALASLDAALVLPLSGPHRQRLSRRRDELAGVAEGL